MEVGIDHASHPGPVDQSVLTLQPDHRSTSVWCGEDSEPLTCRRCDGAFWRLGTLDTRVQRLLMQAGFYGVYKVGCIQLDHALITALVERWRQETHTFHLPVGEVTITLQDVSILWGLPIDGDPVTGVDTARSTEEWQGICQELLGFTPPSSSFDSGSLKLKCIEDHLKLHPLREDAPDHVVKCYARAHIMQLLGGLLLPDASNNKVKLLYLPLLTDLEAAGKLSWGSAVLASLYRALCRATRPSVTSICGPLVLLQIWAWERLLIHPEGLAPRQQPLQTPTDAGDGDQALPVAPYGSRWNIGFKLGKVGKHALVLYRNQLDCLKDDQFVWQPYTSDVIAALPDYCLNGKDIWQSVSPLICFDIVEFHHPDRVLRQFGQQQRIPANCNTSKDLHLIDRRGRQNTDWIQHHKQYIDMWGNRHARIVCSPPLDGPMDCSDPYMSWYLRITRLLIGNPTTGRDAKYKGPGAILKLMAESLQQIYFFSGDAISYHDEVSKSSDLKHIQDTCARVLRDIHQDHRLTSRPNPAPLGPTTSPNGPPEKQSSRPRTSSVSKELLGLSQEVCSSDINLTSTSVAAPSHLQSHHVPTTDIVSSVTLCTPMAPDLVQGGTTLAPPSYSSLAQPGCIQQDAVIGDT